MIVDITTLLKNIDIVTFENDNIDIDKAILKNIDINIDKVIIKVLINIARGKTDPGY